MDTQIYLDKIVAHFKEELKENLLGIYLHGSLSMGCFNPHKSDVDFIVVIKDRLTSVNGLNIAKIALNLHNEMPNARGLEFHVILESYLAQFVYPTPCEFHYSDFHKERYHSDTSYLCGGYEDYDLASQLVVAYHRGLALYGKPLNELYEPIEKQYYLASILYDIENANADILHNTMYITLNLCRVLHYLREDIICSKKEGGEWGITSLPIQYHDLIKKCLGEYTGSAANINYEDQPLSDFAQTMLHEIKRFI
ncbi:aminoglycoside adenylyltransferase domain-containing protein [Paenibacillus arenosi]|uniref:aminoglycoside adenylyltransferase domain-containing protein n=1 Tax=Paenibacillus arenosi TaxID=2774142 RepID=UPI001CDB8CAA|nr:aminoglycoside adenylyltransferase domain-containing protein [Paenibacillus arenosi]